MADLKFDPKSNTMARTGGPRSRGGRESFSQDFKRFFLRGLAALLPTLITLLVLIKVWQFLWDGLGQYLLAGAIQVSRVLSGKGPFPQWTAQQIDLYWNANMPAWVKQLIGVTLAVVLVYIVGLFVGNFIGRAARRLAELAVMRVPLIRAIYPAVRQVTDFVLAERKQSFEGSRVVACEPHSKGIWSIGLVTGDGIGPLGADSTSPMITVFVPSTPTAFSGYLLVVPRDSVVELPLTVEQAMRLLVSGGVINPLKS
jgi:uncharacterized membrane protein